VNLFDNYGINGRLPQFITIQVMKNCLFFPHRLIRILAGRKITVALPDLLELLLFFKFPMVKVGGPVSQIFFRTLLMQFKLF
jgi:hypothetical protein